MGWIMSPTVVSENEIRYIPASYVGECESILGAASSNRLMFVSEGIVFCSVNGRKCQFVQGDVIMLRIGDECVFFSRGGGDTKVCAMVFGQGVLADISEFIPSRFFAEYSNGDMPPIVTLRGIQKNKTARDMQLPASEGREFDTEFMRLTAANVMYDCFVSRADMPEWLETPPDWFIEYYLLLSRHYVFTKPFNEIMSLAGKSREYISRLFKSATGKNISDHIIDLRVAYACNLLKNSSMDVMGISFECGFENLSTFYHHFSPRVGMPPKRYRTLARRA